MKIRQAVLLTQKRNILSLLNICSAPQGVWHWALWKLFLSAETMIYPCKFDERYDGVQRLSDRSLSLENSCSFWAPQSKELHIDLMKDLS